MVDKKIIAITGPSGAGKTTLGNKLSKNYNIVIPSHCTTREARADDVFGFYKYLCHSEYKELADSDSFLITSGDSKIISKENGNFYGVLKSDCEIAFQKSDDILIYVSYKDIEQLNNLKNKYTIRILNLTFFDISANMKYRLINCLERHQTLEQINKRVNCALEYEKKYGEYVKQYSKTIYTDLMDEQQTYDETCKILMLNKKGK